MFTIIDSQNALKRRVTIASLSLSILAASIATVLHYLEPHPHPLNLRIPLLLIILFLGLLIRLYTNPNNLQQVIHLGLSIAILCIVVPSWFFTLTAFSSHTPLIQSLPPLISGLFLIMMIMMIMLRPKNLLVVALITWMAIASPILIYLVLHPAELMTLRGLDIMITLGPAMGLQIVLLYSFNRLQDLVDRLYQERLQYYEKIIERQSIRQRAIEHAMTQIHNGPLQSLSLLMRDLQREHLTSTELLQKLQLLNTEIRAVGHNLTHESDLDPILLKHLLRLGEGTCIDLNHPLHNLFHEVYACTLKRHLPHFQTIQVKVRNFAPVEPAHLTLELKRDLCLWLEEALCNVGKHAQGTTRLVVTGQPQGGDYVLKVQDNGVGLTSELEQQASQFCTLLAQRLDGRFQRSALPTGGVVCELAWNLAIELSEINQK